MTQVCLTHDDNFISRERCKDTALELRRNGIVVVDADNRPKLGARREDYIVSVQTRGMLVRSTLSDRIVRLDSCSGVSPIIDMIARERWRGAVRGTMIDQIATSR